MGIGASTVLGLGVEGIDEEEGEKRKYDRDKNMDLNIVENKKDDAAILPRVSIRLINFYFLFNYTEK